jgi:peptidoglycan/xylan/chitin deacetylase (PgdA/CDA1 family)
VERKIPLMELYNRLLNYSPPWLKRPGRNRLAIFMYHAVVHSPLQVFDWCFIDASSFRAHMQYLGSRYELLPLTEATSRLQDGTIDRPTAVVTLDDGFQNSYDVAFPILRELGIPATIFLVTGLVDTADTFWFSRLHRAVTETDRPWVRWEGNCFDLSTSQSKARALKVQRTRLKRLAQPQLLDQVCRIALDLGDDPTRPIEIDSPYRVLNSNAIREMAQSGFIEFGAHTESHAILSRLPPEAARDEIEQSIAATQRLTEQPCVLFAYPNGLAKDYDARHRALLQSCGVRAAVTAINGLNGSEAHLLDLRRFGIGANFNRRDLARVY